MRHSIEDQLGGGIGPGPERTAHRDGLGPPSTQHEGLVPDGALLDALRAAAKRGVDVRVLVPWISNHVVVDWLTRGYFTVCLKAGIRVFGYQDMLHAKTCTIDGQWSTIGTANLDRLSAVGNYEINVEVYSEALARQMEELFKCDMRHAFTLTLEEWLRRPWYTRLGERILAPLRWFL